METAPAVGFGSLSFRHLMQIDFRDARIFFEVSDNRISKMPHYHVMFELFAVLKGELLLEIEDINVRLSEGDLCLIPPWKCHQAFECAEQSEYINILFMVEAKEIAPSFQRLLVEASAFESMPFEMRGQDDITACLRQLTDKELQKGPFSEDIRHALCQMFFALLSRKLAATFKIDVPKYTQLDYVTEKGMQHFVFALDVLTSIHRHHREDITFEDFAKHFLVSPGHMRRMLKETYNKSFQELLTETRLMDARQKLLHTDLNINQIAEQCGYHSYELFCKTFRRVMRMTPTEYRERNRTAENSKTAPEENHD